MNEVGDAGMAVLAPALKGCKRLAKPIKSRHKHSN